MTETIVTDFEHDLAGVDDEIQSARMHLENALSIVPELSELTKEETSDLLDAIKTAYDVLTGFGYFSGLRAKIEAAQKKIEKCEPAAWAVGE